MLLTGKQLKEMAAERGWLLVKFLPFENLEGVGRDDYRYKYGLNTPAEHINLSPEDTCCAGGLYFTYVKKGEKNNWVKDYAYKVSVPDNTNVYFYEDEVKFKTSALIIEREWNQEYGEYIDLNPEWLKIIKEQMPEICLAAVQKCGKLLCYVKEQTPEICLAAVQQNGWALKCVKEQTLEICLAAVQQNGWALTFIKEQVPETCLAAVQQEGLVLKYVKKQTPEICLAAVQQNGRALQYVEKQMLEIWPTIMQ